MNINRIVLAGRLTRAVDVRKTTGGTTVINIGCAINRRVKRNGQWIEEAVFVDAQMYGSRAEAFAKFHGKGSAFCFPDAELVWEQWEAKDGSGKRSKLYVQANAWEFVGSKSAAVNLSDESTPF